MQNSTTILKRTRRAVLFGTQITILAAMCIGIIGFTSKASAGTFADTVSLDSMTRRSDLIVIAEVRIRNTSPAPKGAVSSVETYSELRVVEYLKGTGDQTLVLRQLGGVTTKGRQQVSGDASLVSGKKVVLFLRSTKGGPLKDFVHLTLLGYSAYDVIVSRTHTIVRPHLRDKMSPSSKSTRLTLGEETSLERLRKVIAGGASR